VQLRRLEEFIAARAQVASWYREALAAVPIVEMLGEVGYPARHAWHLLVVRVRPDRLTLDRNALMQALKDRNIGAGLHFKALHLHPLYRDGASAGRTRLPHATRASETILSLPLFPGMSRDDVADVAAALADVMDRHAA
jgi:dTDP-4-amino-4,6-dideoxygalactose transaminase